MAAQHGDEWSKENCDTKHRAVNFKFGGLLIVMVFAGGAVGAAFTYSRSAEATAERALYNCEILSVRSQEFRTNLEKQLERQDSWMRNISAKQDQMNDTLNRMAAKEK